MFLKIVSGGSFKRHKRFAGDPTERRRIFIGTENQGIGK